MTRLIIVESPAKCSKIQSFLGDGYRVVASMGHIRALVEKLDSVGIDRGWDPIYEELSTKKDAISKLRKAAKEASEVWLATDDDREGEGIAWHICHILKLNPSTTPRIVFHEITKPAILSAVASPRFLDMNRVNAQQARSMLDLLVGFTISRVLWTRVAPKLSAGRCQTPALRLVVDRDNEINNHTARNYWQLRGEIESLTMKADGEFDESVAKTTLTKAGKSATVCAVKERISSSSAPAPLITSTLQQEASALHGLGPKQTMAAAQKLYEAGHITYMRTDNPQLSEEACIGIREHVSNVWGEDYVGPKGQHQLSADPASEKPTEKPKKKKTAAFPTGTAAFPTGTAADVPAAQAAHEAIRPTHPELTDIGDAEHAQKVVYRLIWRRAVQSQMSASKTHVRNIQLSVENTGNTVWNAEQTKPAFQGWRVVEQTEKSIAASEADTLAWDQCSPKLAVGSQHAWSSLTADEVFTKPPGRYTEATLIRELEKRGIGRPSTFASLVTTLFDRDYVEKTNAEGKTFETKHLTRKAGSATVKESKESHKSGADKNKIRATPLGISVTECLQRDFNDLFAYEFTAQMETGLDAISSGNKVWKSILQETWLTYKDRYLAAIAEKEARSQTVGSCRVVQTKKGPFLVRKKADGTADEFAPLPEGITASNAAEKLTEEIISSAFTAAQEAKHGETIGVWNETEIVKKKGPYGFYAQAGEVKVPWKPDDTEETIVAKLEAKNSAFERKVGDFVIRQGPYGLYFMKTGTKGKPKFVGIPKDKDANTISEKELVELYAVPAAPKFKKTAAKTAAKKTEKN
jgi:DNA topoisomerase-1